MLSQNLRRRVFDSNIQPDFSHCARGKKQNSAILRRRKVVRNFAGLLPNELNQQMAFRRVPILVWLGGFVGAQIIRNDDDDARVPGLQREKVLSRLEYLSQRRPV